MSNETQPASYSLITEDNAPVLLRNIFDLVESRYVRRARYVEDVSYLMHEIDRLNLLNDYTPYIDTDGNMCFSVPDDTEDGLLSINAAGELILNDNDSQTSAAFSQMRFNVTEDGYLMVTQVDPEDGV